MRRAPYDPPSTARISGFGGISTLAFLRGSSQPPSWPKPARPQASGLGFDPGRNAWVESWVWGLGSSSFQPRLKHARPKRKRLGRAEICHGYILLDPHQDPQGSPHRAQGPPGFSGLGKSHVNLFPGRVWGKLEHPPGPWGYIQSTLTKAPRQPPQGPRGPGPPPGFWGLGNVKPLPWGSW